MTEQAEAAPVQGAGGTTVDAVVAERAARREAPTEQPEETEQQASEQSADDATQEADTNSEVEPTAEEGDGAETPTEATDEAKTEAEQPPIQAPHSWDAEAKADFAQLPRPLQEKIAKRESERDKAVAKAQQDAAELKKQVQGETEYRSRLSALLDQAGKTFKAKWDLSPDDWRKWFQENPTEATKAKAEFDFERAELSNLAKAQQVEQQREFEEYVKAEEAKLPEIAPELADPEKGKERRAEVAEFLRTVGVPDEALSRISAVELALAHDAMRYRRAAKAAVEPLKEKRNPSPVVRPSGARQGNTSNQELERLKKRADSSGKLEDTLAYRKALKRAQG